MVNEELDNLWDKSITKLKRIGVIILLLIIALLLVENCNGRKSLKSAKDMYASAQDTLKIWVDKDGYNRAQISVLQAQKADDFITMATKDSTIIKLQQLVKDNKGKIKTQGSISIINTEGNVDIKVPTTVIDTSKTKCNPTYTSPFNLKGWVTGDIVAKRDSISVILKYKDEFNLIIGREKTGFLGLGRGKPFADLTSKSPYTMVKEMRVYENEPKPAKNFHVGPGVFYGIGRNFVPEVFIGAGIMWTPINF